MRFGYTIKKIGIKACSVLLFVLMLSLVMIIPASGVDSAGEVKFVDMSTPDSSLAAIVEGNSIDLEVKLNGDFQPADPPFATVEGGVAVKDNIILYQTGGSNGRYEMTAGFGAATDGQASTYTPLDVASSAVYTINPQIIALLTEGDVTEQASGAVYSNTVESVNPLGITVSSTISLNVTGAETDVNSPTFAIVDATGDFLPYKDGTVALANFEDRTLELRITADGRQPLEFTFRTSQRLETDDDTGEVTGIVVGSTFNINFAPPVINGVVLTVVSPQQVVNEVAASIGNNPTSPNATDTSGLPFIDLNGEDTLSHISENSFSLLKAVEKYNVPTDNLATAIRIDWAWQPVNVAADGTETPVAAGDPLFDVVRISDGRDNALNANIVPKVDDVVGYMQYTVDYNIPDRYYPSGTPEASKVDMVTATGQVRVTIRGTGVPPEIGDITTRQGGANDSGYTEATHAEIPDQYDVFQGDRPLYSKLPIAPYYVSAVVEFGAKNSAADYAVIEASSTTGTPNAFEININGAGLPYNLGDRIENPSPDGEGTFLVSFTAKQAGSATYTIKFYQDGELMSTQISTGRMNTLDTTPSDDSSFLSFEVNSDQLTGDFEGYPLLVTPVANTEVTLTVPHKVEAIMFKALVNDTNADRSIKMELYVGGTLVPAGSTDPPHPGIDKIDHGSWSKPINILDATEDEYVFYFTITAEDKSSTIYPVRVIRERASTDATMKTLSAYESDLETAENLLPDFDPTVFDYSISVPYRRDEIYLEYEKNWPGATLDVVPSPDFIAGIFAGREVFKLKYDDSVSPIDNVTTITFKVTAEDLSVKTYTLNVTRLAPSTDASVTDFFFTNQSGEKIDFDDGQQFVEADTKYYITIPYSTESLKLNITPNDEFASAVNVSVPLLTGANDIYSEKVEEGEDLPIIDIGKFEVADVGEDPISLMVYVTAEDTDFTTSPPYEVVVNRLPPNTNTNLASMDITDIQNTTIPSFIFNQALTVYDDLNVDYLVETVIVSPVAASELSTVTIDGVELTEHKTSVTYDLEPVTPKTVVVKVTAESGDEQDYLLHLYRLPPDTDARLASLDVQGIEKLTPNFIPSTTLYSGMMTDNVNEIVITATPVSEYATMRINGDGANSGEATSPISMLYEEQTVEIVVTAQDGRTKMSYIINISNPNLLPTSDDATLKFLDVQSGVMEPEFIPNLDTYTASVLPDVSYVNVIPVPNDPRATMEVKQGSKLLDERDGGYVSSLQDGENEFTVMVTSSDDTNTMEYSVSVYRNDEENAGSLRPITAEDVNFEGESPIVVDIRSYPVVSSDVFEAMEEYPDKTIIFQGHDYSFSFDGADLTKNLPYAEYYDFSVSFSPPEKNEINALMASLGNLSDPGYPVYIYFSQHTTLPATATFTLSLGTAYGNRNLFWHYYNTEGDSERIDYYGYFPTNSRGTFTVPMDHFSTYIVYNRVITGSENKADRFGTDALSTAAGDKVNPNTKETE